MFKWLFIILLVCCPIFKLNAQIVAGQEVLQVPVQYHLPVYQSDGSETAAQIVPNKPWIVYSDRDLNFTYDQPGSARRQRVLSFLEEFFVLEERGDYLKLLKDAGINRLTLSEYAVEYGWISKENLLLSQRCMVTPDKQFDQTVLTIKTVEHYQLQHSTNAFALEFRRGPAERYPYTRHTAAFFQMYFVYKSTETSLLLGKEVRIPEGIEDKFEVILGWAPRSHLFFWNSRIALEPNWDFEAVQERQSGLPIKLFDSRNAAERYASQQSVDAEHVLWDADPLDAARTPGNIPRMLVLQKDDTDSTIFKLYATTQLFNQTNKTDAIFPAGLQQLFIANKLTAKDIQLVQQHQIPLFFQAYSANGIAQQTHPLFKKLLFISLSELHKILEVMENLSTALASPSPRQRFYEVWQTILPDYWSQLPDSAIAIKTIGEIHEKVFGLSGNSPIEHLKLEEVLSNERFGENQLAEFSNVLVTKKRGLEHIFNSNDYPYQMYSGTTKYLWIEENMLP